MKKHLLLFFFSLALSSSVVAQSWKRTSSWGNELTDIHWVNEDVAFASGDRIMLKSIDGGSSWSEMPVPTEARLLSVDFFDHQNGAMAGEGGTLLTTHNGGLSWQTLDLGISEDLLTVYYHSAASMWITGTSGTLRYSADNGSTWTSIDLATSADINSLYFTNQSTGYLTTSTGEIQKTTDGGQSWQPLSAPVSTSLNSLYFTNDTTGYAVGNGGVILKTIDAGTEWTSLQSGTNYHYRRVAFNRNDPDIGAIVGEQGTVLYTDNAGLTFSVRNSRTTERINGLDYKQSTNTVIAVAGAGTILSSTNSGSSWTALFSGTPKDFHSTDFVSDTRGYIAGKEAVILRTTNGGSSYADFSRPLAVDFNAIAFQSNAFGYVVGDDGTVLNTTNSGSAWTALNPATDKDLYGLHFFDVNEGYIVGQDGFIAKTENRGVNWSIINLGNQAYDAYAIGFFENGIGLIIGEEGLLLRNTGQDNWEKVPLGTSENLNGLTAINDSTAMIVGDNGKAFLSNDYGASWIAINTEANHHLQDVAFLDDKTGFVVGNKGLLLKTTDQGGTWELVDTQTFQDFHSLSFGHATTGYAVGDFGMVYQYSCEIPKSTGLIEGQDNICLSQQIYTLSHEDGNELTYEWRIDGGEILEGQGTDRIVVQWQNTGRNAVLVKSQNICGDGPTEALEVTVSTSPTQIEEIIGNGVACLEASAAYEVDSIPGMEYIWEASNGRIESGQGSAHVSVSWQATGAQTITSTPRNACGEGTATAKAINVIQAPAQPDAITGLVQVGLEEQPYEVTPVDGVNYQWRTDGGTILSGQGTHAVVINWEHEGDFPLEVIPTNACNEGQSQLLNINVNLITGIADEPEKPEIKIYPNPSSGNIHINVKGVGNIRAIRVIDPLGRYLRKIATEDGIFDFDIQNLPTGIWLVEVETSAGKTVDKVWIK
ncbi:photosystem II stability/assembly factor-like protein [Echinicola strongylocentroti]|uniref:Photosystem II stability/assembly factor-like protein n=1 Tax=Echinicola strongylocentroti TaxID=1795355 RepID=A0A2Z4IJ97_9BACT|nr:YCF48-related protein [Echinicola strongylocentroti]AWW30819.1 photosystem II stability/assembly factor-like protein [Echinicola strongylocentroti]